MKLRRNLKVTSGNFVFFFQKSKSTFYFLLYKNTCSVVGIDQSSGMDQSTGMDQSATHVEQTA